MHGLCSRPVVLEDMMLILFLLIPKAITNRLPMMEAQYKVAARSAQLRARDTFSGDGGQALTTMASIRGQLYKVQCERAGEWAGERAGGRVGG